MIVNVLEALADFTRWLKCVIVLALVMISATTKITRIGILRIGIFRIAYCVLLLVLKVKFNVTLNRAISIDLAERMIMAMVLILRSPRPSLSWGKICAKPPVGKICAKP